MAIVIPTTLCALVAVAVYHYLVHPAFLSPLSKIPAAHWSCHFSPLWILLTRKNRRENRVCHEAHQRHGPIVRIGPNDVSVDGVEGLKVIYQGGFEKDPWYSVFCNYGVPNMFSSLASKPHSVRKRHIANVYSKSYTQSSSASASQMRHILHDRLLPLLSKSAAFSSSSTSSWSTKTPRTRPRHPQSNSLHDDGLEVFTIFLSTAMDLISAYVFGLENGTNFLQDETYRTHWLDLYLARAKYAFWAQEMPSFTRFCHRWVGWRLYPQWVDDANGELAKWNLGLCDKTFRARQGEEDVPKEHRDPAHEPVVYEALAQGLRKDGSRSRGDIEKQKHADDPTLDTWQHDQRLAIASEVMDHTLAGQETAGIALTYAAWHLSKSPALQTKLRAELLSIPCPLLIQSTNSSSGADLTLPDPRTLDRLPLLHAILIETLRLHAPIPGPEPRRTPTQGCTINNNHIPGGVRIASLAHTLHRDETVFPSPEQWDPARWLAREGESEEEAESRLREMQKRFWVFGSGGRMCIGSNFAMNEMKYILAAVYSNFATSIVDDEGIEQEDAYTARPTGEKLVLRFENVEEQF